uniref:Uncharacterized protein n=1 Tax=Arundo donax TaxID=35708 RepID=A0A0A9EIG6_ARUDO
MALFVWTLLQLPHSPQKEQKCLFSHKEKDYGNVCILVTMRFHIAEHQSTLHPYCYFIVTETCTSHE